MSKDIDMERKLRTLAILLSGILSLSCSGEKDPAHWHYADSYIYEYVHYDEIVLGSGRFGELIVRVKPTGSYGAFSSSAQDIDRYEAKCQLYNDNGYDLKFWTLIADRYDNTVQDRDFRSIKVYSDKNFMEGYPAGADLSPLFNLASRSPYKYICSGYSLPYENKSQDWPAYYREYLNNKRGVNFTIGNGLYPVFGLLAEIQEDEMKLLGFGNQWTAPFEILTLYPTCLPENRGTHTMTVDIEDTNGERLSFSVCVDFSKCQILE